MVTRDARDKDEDTSHHQKVCEWSNLNFDLEPSEPTTQLASEVGTVTHSRTIKCVGREVVFDTNEGKIRRQTQKNLTLLQQPPPIRTLTLSLSNEQTNQQTMPTTDVSSNSPDTVVRPTVTGNFDDKQFSETEVADKVVEQYNEKQARIFYKCVMGGGGFDIHYGCFRSPSDTVYEASKATNERLLTSMDWQLPVTKDSYVLDLGSGHGGISHEIAQRFGCKVMGVNIAEEQNRMNLEQAAALGVGELVDVTLCNFNDGLPAEWSNTFTHVISCEVLCHAANKAELFQEVKRILKPGGAFLFTDIMGADGADEKILKDFTDRNATTKMARPSEYLQLLNDQGFLQTSFLDFSPHLVHYFQSMVDQVTKGHDEMIAEGVAEAYLDKWMTSLTSRVETQAKHKVFAWGIFAARLDGPVF